MFRYIKEHWIIYLVFAALAVILGYGMSVFLGAKWSTPASVKAERVEEEKDADQVWSDMESAEVGGSSSE